MLTPQINPTKIKEKEAEVVHKLAEKREGVFTRFPLLFTLLGTFGLVATFYGFEAIIDRIELLANNPFILLGVGLATLVITGSLYKKLG